MSELGMWPGTPYLIREKSDTFSNSIKNICLDEFKSTQCARQNKIQAKYEKVFCNASIRHLIFSRFIQIQRVRQKVV